MRAVPDPLAMSRCMKINLLLRLSTLAVLLSLASCVSIDGDDDDDERVVTTTTEETTVQTVPATTSTTIYR